MMAQMADLFEGYDLLLSPTMPLTAFPVRQYPQEIGGKEPYPDPAWGFIPFTHPINTLGNPAASIPFHAASHPTVCRLDCTSWDARETRKP